ncbi:uncharacterized protein LOC121298684 isoform X2 [Polyodon spathula]|uniref:uncharacterized protein LOC121298684 isoform X2 n=1 Tax=Polyodon spathula TaxID=7913 RepID=UPI001B7EF25E|nr:uncharacterized protein LOC121298684 isoform X2 [Polyodon spathula]
MRSLLALTVLLGAVLSNTTVNQISNLPGTDVSFPCTAKGPSVNWLWIPKYHRCAGFQGSLKVSYSIGQTGIHKKEVEVFKNRLEVISDTKTGTNSLVLKGVVASDSGYFTCCDQSGGREAYNLEVKVGCYKNIKISISKLPRLGGQVTLYCSFCILHPPIKNTTFAWTFNGKPISYTPEVIEGKKSLTISQVRDIHAGKWGCQSVKDPSQYSEYCLDLRSQTRQKDKGQQITSQDTCTPSPTEKVVSDEPAQGEAGGWNGSLVLVVVIVPLIATAVLLTAGVWFCRRKKSLRMKQRKNADPSESATHSICSTTLSGETSQAMTDTAQVLKDEIQYASLDQSQLRSKQTRPTAGSKVQYVSIAHLHPTRNHLPASEDCVLYSTVWGDLGPSAGRRLY